MGYHWYDLVGNIGVALIIGMYFLLQLGRVRGADSDLFVRQRPRRGHGHALADLRFQSVGFHRRMLLDGDQPFRYDSGRTYRQRIDLSRVDVSGGDYESDC